MHFQGRIAVHELVQLAGTQGEGGHGLAGHEALLAVGDGTSFDQGEDAVADHFGVDAQVVLVLQLHHHGIGNATVADLQGGAVVDEVGHVLADGFLHRADGGQTHFQHRVAAFDEGGDLGDMHVAVAEGEGHVGVHFQDDGPGLLDGGHGVVRAQGEGEVAVLIHGRGHGEDHVGRGEAALDEQGQLGEIVWDEIDPAGLAAGTGGAAVEVGGVAHVVPGFRVDVAVLAQGQNLGDGDVAEVAAGLGEGRQQGRGLAHTGGHDDGVAVVDTADSVRRVHALLLVQGLQIHGVSLLISRGIFGSASIIR